jgi:phage tail protein X
MTIYTTRDGDTADYIAFKFYGSLAGQAVEQLLEANPGLADYGPILPGGLQVNLPKLAAASKVKGVALWD